MNKKYDIGTKVIMRKGHPCGANEWQIVRIGADVKIECCKCHRIVMMSRIEFNKKVKAILEGETKSEKE